MYKLERELGRPSFSGKHSRLGQSTIYRSLRDLRWRKPLLFIILSFEQLFKLRYVRVGGSRLSSGKDSTFSNSSLTKNDFKELSLNKPHSCLKAINSGQFHITRPLKLEGKPPLGNESSLGQLYNFKEWRLVKRCSSKGKEEECHPVIERSRREL
ncbi:hypothetical protein MtrunA17_Chr3g0087591 [Medicago truncatula]|uniref:Uncharacterized protein n=1 Tax=Medicago truncatula TaxID=3880 RepID=A0A396IP66_MEDTR|nr:hypothetical protein MtrunA17_Chr3g0087591 [Medicago truncatula]